MSAAGVVGPASAIRSGRRARGRDALGAALIVVANFSIACGRIEQARPETKQAMRTHLSRVECWTLVRYIGAQNVL